MMEKQTLLFILKWIRREKNSFRVEYIDLTRYIPSADFDECLLGRSNCLDEAICTNTIGSFTCSCKDGYSGDGVNACISKQTASFYRVSLVELVI